MRSYSKCESFLCFFLFVVLAGHIGLPDVSAGVLDEAGDACKWIFEENVRAGYINVKDNISYAALMHNHKLNTIKANAWFHLGKDLDSILNRCRQWAEVCRKENLHLFIGFHWQPYPRRYNYRHIVYADGKESISPCPRDSLYWQNYLTRFSKILAEYSVNSTFQIDGVFVDCEAYGFANMPGAGGYYRDRLCYCDNCFSSFFLKRGVSGPSLPVVEKADRAQWLKKKNLINAYSTFLKKDVKTLASNFEREIHKINPEFFIGMYPTPRNWVTREMARGFGSNKMPMIMFATDCYEGGAEWRIPDEPEKLYESLGISCLYVSGFLFGSYGCDSLRVHLPAVCQKCSGYWLYRMSMLWGGTGAGNLAEGTETEDEYWQCIKNANDYIDSASIVVEDLRKTHIDVQKWRLLDPNALLYGSRPRGLPKVHFQGRQDFLIYGRENSKVTTIVRFYRLGHYDDYLEYTLISPEGEIVLSKKILVPGLVDISFEPRQTGTYHLVINVWKNKFRINSSNAPIAILGSWGFRTLGSFEPLYFYVPGEYKKTIIRGEREPREYFALRVVSPEKRVLTAATGPVDKLLKVTIDGSTIERGLWSIGVEKVPGRPLEGAYFWFEGPDLPCLAFREEWIFVPY